MNNYLTVNGLLESFQSAYKAHHSTETALLTITDDILLSLDRGDNVFLLLLDLSAAFDTVNHSLLLSRLENSFGITGTVLQCFHSYLTGRCQFVEINDTKSSVWDLTVGVPQGSVLGPILYLLYTSPLAEMMRSHGLVDHFYADDTQLYISFKDCDVDVARLRIENCVADICHWMDVNELKLNHDKTEIMLIYSKYHTRPLFSYFSIGKERLTTTANARSLGVVLDDNILFGVHVSDICRSSFNQLRNLSKIRKYLTRESSKIAVHAFITSKLVYYNSLLYGCRKTQLKKLHYIQNTAARIVTQTRKSDHITPVLFDLHGLPVSYRIVFKILLLVFKSLNNLSPSYLADRLSYQSHSRVLQSASKQLLDQSRSITKTYGDKAFSACASKLWNSLPLDLRKSPPLTGFRKELKTYLFRQFLVSGSLFL